MLAVAFPSLKPSARSYTPGAYPQTDFTAQNGARTVVRFGNRRVDSSLSLQFDNITDAQAALILANYEAVNRDWNYVTFAATSGTAGASSELAAYLAETGGSGLLWRYAEPPQVRSVYPGVSSVSCSFVGVLDGN
jgi:hypothetical protein